MDKHFDCLFSNGKFNLHYAFDKYGAAWFFGYELAEYLGYRSDNMIRMCNPCDAIHLTTDYPAVPELELNIDIFNHSLSEGLKGGHRHFTAIRETGVYYIVMAAMSYCSKDMSNWHNLSNLPMGNISVNSNFL